MAELLFGAPLLSASGSSVVGAIGSGGVFAPLSGSIAASLGSVGTLSVGLTAASAFGSIQAGNAQAASLNLQSQQAALNSRIERLQGRQQATLIKDQLNSDLASQNAIFGARGLLQGEGTAQAAEEKARLNASQSIDNAKFNSEVSALNAEQRASNLKSEASSAKTAGFTNAVRTVSNFRKVPLIG